MEREEEFIPKVIRYKLVELIETVARPVFHQ